MYTTFDINQLIDLMRASFPDSRTDMEKKANQYYDLTIDLIRQGFLYGKDTQLNLDQIPIEKYNEVMMQIKTTLTRS